MALGHQRPRYARDASLRGWAAAASIRRRATTSSSLRRHRGRRRAAAAARDLRPDGGKPCGRPRRRRTEERQPDAQAATFEPLAGLTRCHGLGRPDQPDPRPGRLLRRKPRLGWPLANCYYGADPAAGVAGAVFAQVLSLRRSGYPGHLRRGRARGLRLETAARRPLSGGAGPLRRQAERGEHLRAARPGPGRMEARVGLALPGRGRRWTLASVAGRLSHCRGGSSMWKARMAARKSFRILDERRRPLRPRRTAASAAPASLAGSRDRGHARPGARPSGPGRACRRRNGWSTALTPGAVERRRERWGRGSPPGRRAEGVALGGGEGAAAAIERIGAHKAVADAEQAQGRRPPVRRRFAPAALEVAHAEHPADRRGSRRIGPGRHTWQGRADRIEGVGPDHGQAQGLLDLRNRQGDGEGVVVGGKDGELQIAEVAVLLWAAAAAARAWPSRQSR